MKEWRPLFVTSPARAGSTMFSLMLSVNPEIMVASDPYLPLFRSLRNAIVRQRATPELVRAFDPASPMHDYYFDSIELNIMDAIQSADLNIPFDQQERPALLEASRARAQYASPDLLPHLKSMLADNYAEMFEQAIDLVGKTRHAGQRRWVGLKDVWTIEFFAPIARSFDDARFIVLLRDPRAIVASMLAMGARDQSQLAHTLSYARHWRKYAAFVVQYLNNPLFKNRFHVLTFEGLLRAPEEQVRCLCEFLDVNYDPDMLNTDRYFDFSTGAAWTGNSSFDSRLSGITADKIERWRAKLDPVIVKLIDFVCGPEMKLAGYRPASAGDGRWPGPEVLEYIIENDRQPCSWRSDFQDPQKDYGFELFRDVLLGLPDRELNSDLVRRSFLFEEVFQLLRGDPVETII